MAKSKPDMPADMWLHVATDALARYIAGGGSVVVVALESGLTIQLPDVNRDDPRLAGAFASAVDEIDRTSVLQEDLT